MTIKKKNNDSDYKQLERQFNVLADCVDKIDNNNAREICDLQTRVHNLEDTKKPSSDSLYNKCVLLVLRFVLIILTMLLSSVCVIIVLNAVSKLFF